MNLLFDRIGKLLGFLGLIVVSVLIVPTAGESVSHSTAYVTEIRHWSNPSYTRVVINLNRKAASYTHRLLRKDPSINKPRRLYVDIDHAALANTLPRSVPINDGLLKKARAGQYNKKTVRVVLDIESIEDYKIFPLNEPYRIVIDVSGEKKASSGSRTDTRPAPVLDKLTESDRTTLSQQLGLKVNTIVIDAGHGGKDPGAIGKRGLREKDVTLQISQLVRDKLKNKFDRIIMTRDRDVFIPLEERTAIANSSDADLFVSIHINASPRRSASGVETYILNISNDEEAKRVAARENSTSTRSVSDLEFILNDLIKTAKTNDSSRLATAVHGRLVNSLRTRYRNINSNGVKGAPFYVLVGTKMPSILVEASFISNPSEEKRLRDKRYLDHIAEGIAAGVMQFINAGEVALNEQRHPSG